jgi:hypothetical protein
MSAAELAFAVLALLALGAGGTAMLGGPARGSLGLSALALVLAGVLLLYAAPGPALVVAAVLGSAGLVVKIARGEEPEADEARARRRRLAAAFAVLAGLVFVLVGTWARPFVWTGRPVVAGAGFGGLPSVTSALAGTPGLAALGLVIVVAAAACAGPPRHRL